MQEHQLHGVGGTDLRFGQLRMDKTKLNARGRIMVILVVTGGFRYSASMSHLKSGRSRGKCAALLW